MASGLRRGPFDIEDIGATLDDGEGYRHWQADRHAFNRDSNEGYNGGDGGYYDDWDEDGNPVRKKKGVFMDQYQSIMDNGFQDMHSKEAQIRSNIPICTFHLLTSYS